jgi:Glucose-6-phosphate dehydrogenase subunit N-terminal domain/Glucose-6-phosphate dehydrogenase subunit C-terminal domain
MATAVMANRASRASAPASVDDDLAALWREIAREAPVSRAVMSNLVVYCRCAAGDELDLSAPPEGVPIDDVARNHPSRVILLNHDPNAPDEHDAQGPATPLAAHVAVLTFGPSDARYGVEQIVIRAVCNEAALPSIVRRLMLGDIPTSVWWAEDLSGTHPLTPLVTMGRQLVYDSRQWRDVRTAVLALAPLLTDQFRPDLADVNWRRLLPVRQALVHAVSSSDSSKRQRLTSVQIRHRRGEAALAWLFAGWLHSTSTDEVTVDEDPALVDDVLTASFDDGLHVRLAGHGVRIDDPLGPAPFSVAAPGETPAEAIAAELRVLTQDVSLHNALTALVERFGRG